MIPFLDVKATYSELRQEIDSAISAVINSGVYILGAEVEAFEFEFAEYCGALQCVGVGNGLDALYLALSAMEVGPGDEVIVPSNTFIATWLAVTRCGAVPVPVEPDKKTYNLDPSLITAAITPRTKVILPVHLYGQPADLDPILSIAKKNGLRVLEDAAQAHGSSYKGKRIGCHGDVVAWSFYPSKNLGSFGDAGALTTNNIDLAHRIRLMRNYGSREKYEHDIKGINSRIDPIQAAVLRVKLRHLDDWNERRRKLAQQYLSGFEGSDVVLPYVPHWAEPVWHVFVIRSLLRDSLQLKLMSRGIGTLIHYPVPIHLQPAFRGSGWTKESFPLASDISAQALSLPIGPHLSAGEVETVIEATLAAT